MWAMQSGVRSDHGTVYRDFSQLRAGVPPRAPGAQVRPVQVAQAPLPKSGSEMRLPAERLL